MRWSNEDLDIVFSVLPTKENAEKLAKVMGRTTGSIMHVWAWSSNTKKRNMSLDNRGQWAERCREAKIRNGWLT